MKTEHEKQKFIEMRAQGLSYDKIAASLKISKPTLLKWSNELSTEIDNCKCYAMEALIEQYKVAKQHRVEFFASIMQKVIEELNSRSFEEVTVKDLVQILFQMQQKLQNELNNLSFHTGEVEVKDLFTFDIEKTITLPFIY